jgi:hypothetical protein
LSNTDNNRVNTFTSTNGVTSVNSPATASCMFAAGTAAAGFTLKCTMFSGIPAASVQLMTLIQAAATAGSAQGVGAFNVVTQTSGVLIIDNALALPGVTFSAISGGGQLTTAVRMSFVEARDQLVGTLSNRTM